MAKRFMRVRLRTKEDVFQGWLKMAAERELSETDTNAMRAAFFAGWERSRERVKSRRARAERLGR